MTIDVLQWYIDNVKEQFTKATIEVTKVTVGYEDGYADDDGEVYPWFIEAEGPSGKQNEINCYRINGTSLEQCVANLPEYIKAAVEYYKTPMLTLPDSALEN